MRCLLYIALMGCFIPLRAQDTVLQLPDVEYREWSVQQSDALLLEVVKLAAPHRSLAEHLQLQTGIYIRSQGNTVLNSPSFKGLGSMHIPVVIGSNSIQSSMNGTLDLSLLSAVHFNKSELTDGNGDAQRLTNLGPSIRLDRTVVREQQLALSGNSMQNAALSYRIGRKEASGYYGLSIQGSGGPNSYDISKYPYATGSLEHSAFSKLDGFFQWGRSLGRGWSNSLEVFGIGAQRQLPSNPVVRSEGEQGDRLWSIADAIQKDLGKGHGLELNLHSLLERIDYQASSNSQFYRSDALTQTSSLSYSYLRRWTAHAMHSRVFYRSQALLEEVNWNRWQYGIRWQTDTLGWEFQLGLAAIQGGSHRMEPLVDLALGRHWSSHRIKLQLQRVYRIPNLNERYWYQPGYAFGNTDLRAEKGYRADLYYSWNTRSFRIRLNPYTGLYTDMIRWVGSPVRATNVQQVWSRGLDQSITYMHRLGGGWLILDQHLHLVRATYDQRNGISPYGRQLAYTPEVTANLTITYRHGDFGCYINQQTVGRNYITSDNSDWLDPYYLVEIGAHALLGHWRLGILLTNLFDRPYHTEPYRPLPGSQGHITLAYTLP